MRNRSIDNEPEMYGVAKSLERSNCLKKRRTARETSAGKLFYGGTDFVHNKILIIDHLGLMPVIVSGSANFSVPSTTGNDENMLIIKGIR